MTDAAFILVSSLAFLKLFVAVFVFADFSEALSWFFVVFFVFLHSLSFYSFPGH